MKECLSRLANIRLDIHLPGSCSGVSIDCASNVSPLPCAEYLPKQLFIDTTSMAVWDRSKAVTATAFSVWGINIAFMIQGELPPSPLPPLKS
jgi:hypothetical protein